MVDLTILFFLNMNPHYPNSLCVEFMSKKENIVHNNNIFLKKVPPIKGFLEMGWQLQTKF